ncbi:MAG TPA: zf-HC2 domain-containing protein [Pseudonocardiaceae bacterium]|nr:zf-HC2 domain-containing protein [Pseudonocardiaceae bacterium]
MDCTHCREAISARLDGEEGPRESSAVDAHLAICSACNQFSDDAARITKLARCAPAAHAPDISMKVMSAVDELGTVLEVLTDLDRHSTACATAMMAHNTTDMLSATRAALDCADIAAAAHRVLSRDTATDTGVLKAILQAAATAADRCATECGQHAVHHSHCRVHSETARHAAQVCRAQLHHIAG